MFQKYFLFFMIFITSVACGKVQQSTDHAVEAMKRARAAEAHIHAEKEYNVADNLFQEMNDHLDNNNIEQANTTAQGVVDAANTAIEAARKNLAWKLIQQLKQTLEARIDIKQTDPDIYQQATNLLVSAESAYNKTDYETAITDATKGLELLNINTKLYRVKTGDTLWGISEFFYKDPLKWPNIWNANRDKIKHPHWIYPKQQFKIPQATIKTPPHK